MGKRARRNPFGIDDTALALAIGGAALVGVAAYAATKPATTAPAAPTNLAAQMTQLNTDLLLGIIQNSGAPLSSVDIAVMQNGTEAQYRTQPGLSATLYTTLSNYKNSAVWNNTNGTAQAAINNALNQLVFVVVSNQLFVPNTSSGSSGPSSSPSVSVNSNGVSVSAGGQNVSVSSSGVSADGVTVGPNGVSTDGTGTGRPLVAQVTIPRRRIPQRVTGLNW